jgi:DNA repair protein RadC
MATKYTINEVKVITIREMPLPDDLICCDTPDQAVKYWDQFIATSPEFSPDVGSLYVLHLNTRLRATSHTRVSLGTVNEMISTAREVFRAAIVNNAYGIVIMHNHPSGESTPSDADVRITRELFRSGKLLKIELVDHVIVGRGQRHSLKELGYLYL